MAIAFDAAASAGVLSSSALTIPSVTVSSGNDRILPVSFGYYDRTVSALSVAYNGVALTKRRRYENGAAAATSELWYLVAPPVGTASLVITLSASVPEISGAALSLTGVDQTTPIEADNGGSVVTGAHTSHSGSVTTVTPGAWVMDHLLYIFCGDAATSVGGQTERSHQFGTNVGIETSSRGPIATPASESAGWTFSNPGAATSQIIYALKPAAGFLAAQSRRINQAVQRAANY